MKQIELSPEISAAFVLLREARWDLNVYGMGHAQAWARVKPFVLGRINSAGVDKVAHNQYRLFVAEVVSKYRTFSRAQLVAALERVIGKWARYGFDPRLLQQLVCDCHRRFLLLGYATPEPKTGIAGPKRRRRRGQGYEQAVRKRKIRLCPGSTAQEQAARYEAGLARNREVSGNVRDLLKELGLPARDAFRYNPFAYRVDRYCRNFRGPSLARAVSGVIDDCESRGLARPILRAIAATVFGLPDLA